MATVVELGQRVKAKYPGAYDDIPDDELGRRVKAKFPGSYDDFADSVGAGMAMTPQNNPATAMLGDLGNRALAALPSIGGFAGGLFGTAGGIPGAIAGAAAGGAIGEGAREALGGENLDPGRIAVGGASEGAYQAAGGLLAKGAGMAARPVMRAALSNLPKGFPNPVETMLQEGIPVSSGGLAKANKLREESSAKLMRILTKAEGAGTTASKSDVVAPVTKLVGKRALRPSVKAGIEAELAEFMAKHPDQITPTLLKELKKEYQGGASSAFRAALAKGGDTGTAASQRFARALQRGANTEMRKIPGAGATENRTQKLIGTGRAIETAITGPPRLVPHALSGLVGGAVGYGVSHNPVGAAAGIAASEALTSRAAISRYALILNSKAFKALMRQSPRLAAEFIHQSMLGANQSDTTDATR